MQVQVSPRYLSLGWKSSEDLYPILMLQLLGPEDFSHVAWSGTWFRAHQGGFLLTTPVIFGTVAGDMPNKHGGIIQPRSRSIWYGLAWPSFQPLISRTEPFLGWELPGSWQGHLWIHLVKKSTAS